MSESKKRVRDNRDDVAMMDEDASVQDGIEDDH